MNAGSQGVARKRGGAAPAAPPLAFRAVLRARFEPRPLRVTKTSLFELLGGFAGLFAEISLSA